MQPECACPLCGQQVAALPLTILPERGMVVAGGRFAVLTAHEMMVLERLAEVFPRGQSKEDLLGWIYQLRPDEEPEIKIIDVWICKIRRKVAPLGVRIDTMWGRGYALAVEERPRIVRPLETTRGEERGARPGSNKSGEERGARPGNNKSGEEAPRVSPEASPRTGSARPGSEKPAAEAVAVSARAKEPAPRPPQPAKRTSPASREAVHETASRRAPVRPKAPPRAPTPVDTAPAPTTPSDAGTAGARTDDRGLPPDLEAEVRRRIEAGEVTRLPPAHAAGSVPTTWERLRER